MEKTPNSKNEPLNTVAYLKYSGIAVQMIVILCAAAFGGMWLDEYFQVKSKLITVFLLIFALIISMYTLIRGLIPNDKK